MNLQNCRIAECGAKVLVAQIAGRPFMLNPNQIEVAVADENGEFRLTKGYQPHHYTCVDIATRPDGRQVAVHRRGAP